MACASTLFQVCGEPGSLSVRVFQVILVAPAEAGESGTGPGWRCYRVIYSKGAHAWRPYGQSHLDDRYYCLCDTFHVCECECGSGVALCLPFDLEGTYALPASLPEKR